MNHSVLPSDESVRGVVPSPLSAKHRLTPSSGRSLSQGEAVNVEARLRSRALTALIRAASDFFKEILPILNLTDVPDSKRDQATQGIAIKTNGCSDPDNLSALHDRISSGSIREGDYYKVAAVEFVAHISNFLTFRSKECLNNGTLLFTDASKNDQGGDRQVFVFSNFNGSMLLTSFKLFINIYAKVIVVTFDKANDYVADLKMIEDGVEWGFDIDEFFRANPNDLENDLDEEAIMAGDNVQRAAVVSFVIGLPRFSQKFPVIIPSSGLECLEEKILLKRSMEVQEKKVSKEHETREWTDLRVNEVAVLLEKAQTILQPPENTRLRANKYTNRAVVKGFNIHNGDLNPKTLFVVGASSKVDLCPLDKDLLTKVFSEEGFVVLTYQLLDRLHDILSNAIIATDEKINRYQSQHEEFRRKHTFYCKLIDKLREDVGERVLQVNKVVDEAVDFYSCVAERFYSTESSLPSAIAESYRKVICDHIYSRVLNLFLSGAWHYIHTLKSGEYKDPTTFYEIDMAFKSEDEVDNRQVFMMLLTKILEASTTAEFYEALGSVKGVISDQSENHYSDFFQRSRAAFRSMSYEVGSGASLVQSPPR